MLQETVRVVRENVDFTNVKKLLDLGGGHGLYAIAFSKLNEDLQAFVFDLPPVTKETRYFIKKIWSFKGGCNSGGLFLKMKSEVSMILSSLPLIPEGKCLPLSQKLPRP
ncbi:methyltransferase [Methanosarcina horonobensis]|uniref:methyltransferase n=1 Tax=Methanosarcina horonobensis TaxID=418008 RepID=UPI0022B88A94|nr:methyltransferase [Methanosarcina horonobensis]